MRGSQEDIDRESRAPDGVSETKGKKELGD